MNSTSVALLGDSILDNFYWLDNPEHDLTYELEQRGFKVLNIAVDESQLLDVVNGTAPRQQYIEGRNRRMKFIPYPVAEDGKVYPLELLGKTPTDAAILSVGGNDLRMRIFELLGGVSQFLESVLDNKFRQTMISTLREIKKSAPKTVLVVPYYPYLGPNSTFALFAPLVEQVYDGVRKVYQQIAQEADVAIFDLSRTFDRNNRAHYGSTDIEPSNLTTKCMADYITEIITNYDSNNVYYAPDCSKLIHDEIAIV